MQGLQVLALLQKTQDLKKWFRAEISILAAAKHIVALCGQIPVGPASALVNERVYILQSIWPLSSIGFGANHTNKLWIIIFLLVSNEILNLCFKINLPFVPFGSKYKLGCLLYELSASGLLAKMPPLAFSSLDTSYADAARHDLKHNYLATAGS